MTQYLADEEVRRRLELEPLIAGMRQALIDLSAGRVVQPLRSVMELPSEGLLFMKPVQTGDVLATKLLTLMPRNAERGLPTLLATIVLMDASDRRDARRDGRHLDHRASHRRRFGRGGRLPRPARPEGGRDAGQRRPRPHPRPGASRRAADLRDPRVEPKSAERLGLRL